MSKPLISVILPVYNAAATVGKAIKSILSQSLEQFELLIINDGSTDDTLKIINSFADSQIKCYTTPNRGIARALNFGIKLATAPYIARMDADDISYEHRLQRQFDYLEQHTDIDIVSCLIDSGGDPKKQAGYMYYVHYINSLVDPHSVYNKRFQESALAHPSVMLRKSLFERFGGYNEVNLPEDYELWLRLMHNGVKIGKVNEVLFWWNDKPNRLSRTSTNYSDEQFYKLKAYFFKLHCLRKFGNKLPHLFIWGTGRLINKWSGYLTALGFEIKGFIEVKKHSTYSPNVLHYTSLPAPGGHIVLSFVRDREGKIKIEQHLFKMGYKEGHNFFMFS